MKTQLKRYITRYFLIVLSSVLSAINIKVFCDPGDIIPGGFTGITLLFNETMSHYFDITIPFSIVYYILNIIPIYIGFRYVGKWFTFYSCIIVFLTGLFTDMIPDFMRNYLHLNEKLLYSVFGGLLGSFAAFAALKAGTTGGGTDNIAIYISEKKNISAWNYIFAGNCVVLALAAFLFTPEKALFSIIFQFTTTIALNKLYKDYQQKTLLIITNKPQAVYEIIRDKAHHDATSFTGLGLYKNAERILLYSVISSTDAPEVISEIKRVDPEAFVNVLQTDMLKGRFYHPPKE